ncbi:MAG: D-alanine--D-alanine ligase [Actinomycetota bacterium]|nr:D-alanine--D-alanine ligase [Actinomycetota bacterium]
MKSKIAVLMGGRSLERSVSLKSGRRVAQALRGRGFSVLEIDVNELLVPTLLEQKPDLVYIALHGKYGEDGTIQELLELMGIPFTGPGPLSSIIGFNKILSKELFKRHGIPTPRYYALSAPTFEGMGAAKLLDPIWGKLGPRLVVKPSAQGSALGLSIVSNKSDMASAILSALGYDDKVLIEEFIDGCEIAVSVIGDQDLSVLPPVEIVPESGFFDFDSRYTPGKTEYFVPARLEEKVLKEAERMALEAHKLLGCKDISRVDIIVGKDSVPYVLELNVSPGMTETSLLPIAAEAAGISFGDLVERLVRLALGE